MEKFESLLNLNGTSLEIDTEVEKLLIEAQVDKHIKNYSEAEYFERVLVAGEMTELGLDAKKNFSEHELENIQKDLVAFREECKQGSELHIGLVKYLYRLNQVGVGYPPLTSKEIERLTTIPHYLRQHPENGNLVYLPQLAAVLEIALSELADKNDGQLVKEYLQQEFAKGGEEEMKAIMVSGMLQDLDPRALEELIKSDYWKEDSWQKAIQLVKKYKHEKDGYALARSLPSLKKLQSAIFTSFQSAGRQA